MRTTLRDVIARPDLNLLLPHAPGPAPGLPPAPSAPPAPSGAPGSPDPLDVDVTWVAASDLADPTPFLDQGNVLLTTGGQFAATPADEWVRRLAACGVVAVGFGVGVLHAQTPLALINACKEHRMPLFEVPYHVSFLAVIRHAAHLIESAGHHRDTWALTSARAISLAALRKHALPSVLSELSRRLDRWVCLLDPRGRIHTVRGINADDPLVITAREHATTMALADRRSSSTVTLTEPEPVVVSMQTIGAAGDVRGVLVVGGSRSPDVSEQMVITSAVALAGLALGRRDHVELLNDGLRAALWRCLLAGDVPFVEHMMEKMGEALPTGPVRVVVWQAFRLPDVVAGLERIAATHTPILFTCDDDPAPGSVKAVVGAAGGFELAEQVTRAGMRAGVSDPAGLGELDVAFGQARRALAVAAMGQAVAFDRLTDRGGLLGLLRGPDAHDVARAWLAPLTSYDGANHTALVATMATWLGNDANYDAAARAMGVHRHTLRDRVARAERVLGVDLSAFEARTQLWLALKVTGALPT